VRLEFVELADVVLGAGRKLAELGTELEDLTTRRAREREVLAEAERFKEGRNGLRWVAWTCLLELAGELGNKGLQEGLGLLIDALVCIRRLRGKGHGPAWTVSLAFVRGFLSHDTSSRPVSLGIPALPRGFSALTGGDVAEAGAVVGHGGGDGLRTVGWTPVSEEEEAWSSSWNRQMAVPSTGIGPDSNQKSLTIK
jgi:hypothetical protein